MDAKDSEDDFRWISAYQPNHPSSHLQLCEYSSPRFVEQNLPLDTQHANQSSISNEGISE